jgi:8-oxo-dGTP pyrophosphatase MutT (NUDIX family)
MHRDALRQLLQQYNPQNFKEISFKQRMLDFLESGPDCFERSRVDGHFTASAMLINKEGSHALLMHHMKLNQWFQLGGHCDGNHNVLTVAIKEAQEESGVEGIEPVSSAIFDIDIHGIPANKKEVAHDHFDVRFLLRVTSDEEIKKNGESKELRWIPKDLAKLPTDNPSVVRMFNKWIQGDLQ